MPDKSEYIYINELSNLVIKQYYLTEFSDAYLISFDITFEEKINLMPKFKFKRIPMPTSVIRINKHRFIFNMATTDLKKFNSSYYFRYLVTIERENGKFSSVNGRCRKDWDFLFNALGEPDQWEEYDSEWPAPK